MRTTVGVADDVDGILDENILYIIREELISRGRHSSIFSQSIQSYLECKSEFVDSHHQNSN